MNRNIEDLLSKLTLEEKTLMLAGAGLWRSQAIERLGIPYLKVTDGPNGVRGVSTDAKWVSSASFPIGSAMGATWDSDLVHKIGKALGQEVKTKDAHVLLAPTVNIHRSPIAGRNFECFSEDPFLTARMAVAYITGLQSEDVGACVKHYVCNDQEFERHSISSEVDERTMQEIYLPPFEAAVKEAKSWTIMSAYNKINGIWASEHDALLLDLLKEDWGFDGLVISDWFGSYTDKVVNSGLDLEMPGPGRWMGQNVHEMVASGEVSEKVIDEKVRRLLRTLVRTNAFEQTVPESERAVDLPAHRALMRKVGTEAIVLLKNDGDILPIQGDRVGTMAIIGQHAQKVTFQGGGSSQVRPHYVEQPLNAVRAQAATEIEILYAQGVPVDRYPQSINQEWLRDESGTVGGLTRHFYGNRELTGEVLFSNTGPSEVGLFGATGEHFDPNNFSMRAVGSMTVPVTGTYQFTISTIGRGRWLLDGEPVIDLWDTPIERTESDQPRANTGIFEVNLEAGRSYEMQLDFAAEPGMRWRSIRLGCEPPTFVDPIEEAIAAASAADVAVVFAGLTSEWESEGFDRIDMDLPLEQNEMIRRVAAVNKNTVVVLNTGSPIRMPWIDEVAAVLQVWYLGQESGNAIADVLLGAANPGGRMPTTIPKRLEDTPAFINFPGENGRVRYGEGIFVGYRYYEKRDLEPLFPFGHGLSYTNFEYNNLKLDKSDYSTGDPIHISLEVTNSGDRAGSDVVQVYVRDVESRLVRPLKELKGFKKVYLEAGETQKVDITLTGRDLAYYDDSAKAWVTEPGDFEILVGRSSADIKLSGKFKWKE